ncbi:hypothetical protein DKK74_04325 [Bifidobacterium asteroides]|uniref:Uncharacterized protein n=1 Tax=Bifidobacterium asteroides TaxID=1684 RepID=A0A318MV59_9BIFI|nr:hypothetical protein DKK74_04325 [Bifidobacterium asteroides]
MLFAFIEKKKICMLTIVIFTSPADQYGSFGLIIRILHQNDPCLIFGCATYAVDRTRLSQRSQDQKEERQACSG